LNGRARSLPPAIIPVISRLIRTTTLAATLALASCVAPIGYTEKPCETPPGEYTISPLDAALRELEAGKAARDPMIAAGHFIECAHLAGDKALEGETGGVALYNHAVGRLVEKLQAAKSLPWGRSITVGSGSIARTLRGKLEPGAPSATREFRTVDNLTFKGKYAAIHAKRPGVGAPLIAISPPNPDYRRTLEPMQMSVALTAVLRRESPGVVSLELHDPLEVEKISIAGRNPTLAADFSAPISLTMAVARPDKLGLTRLLNPQKYSDTARLMRLQKYDKDRIPVLMVHGLQDTPATWAPMYHSLMQDPQIRAKYQFWVFSYPSGYPYPYSASLLRKELDSINRAFPGHKDIVIVGHSMGGITSRLICTDAEDKIWRGLFGKGPDEMKISGASSQLLRDSIIFHHRTDINRAIFIAAPHRGSELASSWIGRFGSRLVRMPTFLTDARNAVASVVTADSASLMLDRAPNSIDTLSPNNGFVREVNKLPVAPGIPYHSIIGDRGKGGNLDGTKPSSNDSFVPYWSSHLNGAASEKIIPSNHSAHQHPEGIAETRRILRLHAGL
jgi:pimeloyl-ACP methyl ester carboxylesterase